MLYAVMGFFKPGIDTVPAHLQGDFNEHLAQPLQNIRLAGPLRDQDGKRVGYMALIEAEAFAAAQSYLDQSPYFIAGLYERTEVVEYTVQAGRL